MSEIPTHRPPADATVEEGEDTIGQVEHVNLLTDPMQTRSEWERERIDNVERQLRSLGVELTEHVTVTAGGAIVEGSLEGIAVVDDTLVLIVNEGETDRPRLTVLLWQNVGAIRVVREE